jgi:hypothetical protein
VGAQRRKKSMKENTKREKPVRAVRGKRKKSVARKINITP